MFLNSQNDNYFASWEGEQKAYITILHEKIPGKMRSSSQSSCSHHHIPTKPGCSMVRYKANRYDTAFFFMATCLIINHSGSKLAQYYWSYFFVFYHIMKYLQSFELHYQCWSSSVVFFWLTQSFWYNRSMLSSKYKIKYFGAFNSACNFF